MATYYWVGGAGNWDNTNTAGLWKTTSGGATNAPNAPLATDTATFDTNSGTGAVSIAATATCAACNFGQAGITATLTANHTVTFSNFTISAGTFDCSTFDMTFGSNTSLTGGTFTCNGGLITGSNFQIIGAIARAITLNASTLTLSGGLLVTGSNVSLNAGTSQINFSGTGSLVNLLAGQSLYNVSYTNSALLTTTLTAFTCNNLTFASKTGANMGSIFLVSDLTINGTLTIPAPTTSGSSRYFIRSNTLGNPCAITATSVSLNNDIDFRDITVVGTAWTGTRFGDCGGNTNITFPASKTVYFNLAGAQNYSATGWATTPTGTPATTNFPLAQDTAAFTDTNPAASSTITIDASYNIGTLDYSSRTLALTFSVTGSPHIYGNITLSTAITPSGTGLCTYAGRNKTQTITSAGRTFTGAYAQATIGGEVVFADAFMTTSAYTLTNGSLSTNYNFTTPTFSSNNSNTRSITLGAMVWSLTGTGTVWNAPTTTGLTFTPGTSKISLTGTTATARTFAGGNLTYNNLEIGGATGISTLTVTGSNTFNTISSTKTVAHTITFTAGTTTTVADWTVTGTAGKVVTIGSATAASHNLVKTGGGNISVDYMSISRSNAS